MAETRKRNQQPVDRKQGGVSVFGDLERLIDDIYPYRWFVLALVLLASASIAVVGYRRGWHWAVARYKWQTALIVVLMLVILTPVGFYTLSPLWTRTTLDEASPLVAVSAAGRATSVPMVQQRVATTTATTAATPRVIPTVTPAVPATATPEDTAEMDQTTPESLATVVPDVSPTATITPAPELEPEPTTTPEPPPFVPGVVRQGEFYGADDFHFAFGTALIIEAEPGVYVLRFENFSVRNGPDLRVYLSPDPNGYGDGAWELGALKATDGSFNYDLPLDTDVSQIASVIIWCEPFAVLFGTAPLQ
jgi:hypothetical protein